MQFRGIVSSAGIEQITIEQITIGKELLKEI